MDRRAILLLSGGLDSSSLIFWMKMHGILPVPLFIDYGQPTCSAERDAASAIAEAAECPPPLTLRSDRIYREVTAEYAVQPAAPPQHEYFPSRNLLLIAIASMYAYRLGIRRVMIGVISGTASLFPDTSKQYIDATNKLIALEHPRIAIEAPFVDRSKREVLEEALRAGLPYQLTYSCNLSVPFHCWTCASCQDRWDAFSSLHLF